MKQLLLILNPTSGTKKAAKKLDEIIGVFNRADFDVHVYVTQCRGDAANAVKRLGTAADLIVCCGGDGTLNETVTGIIESGLQTPIGYIPAGSTNDFAGTLHLSGDVVRAAQQIADGKATAFDVGQFGSRYFTYIAAFGAFTKASYTTPQSVKNALGHMAYVLQGIQELPNIRKTHLRIETDTETVEDDFLFGAVCNSTSVGGILTLNSDVVDVSDGQFELLLVRGPRDLIELRDCIAALQKQQYDCAMITFRRAKRVKICSDAELYWALDGEKSDGIRDVEITNLHKRMHIVY